MRSKGVGEWNREVHFACDQPDIVKWTFVVLSPYKPDITMRFDTSQHMKLSQQMKLAPRMIQSMEILQMSLAALEERIEQEMESNVTLETVEPGADQTQLAELREEERRDDTAGERELNVEENGSADDFERLDNYESSYGEAAENEYSAASQRTFDEPTPTYARARLDGERDGKMDAMANTAARPESLGEQLLEQWAVVDIDEELREPGKLIIGYLEADGLLHTDLATIANQAPQQTEGSPFTHEVLERALIAIQLLLEPPGLGARDLRECLLLQVDALLEEGADAALQNARRLIEECFDDLIHNRIPKIAQKTELSIDEIKAAIDQMRRLTLHPGKRLVDDTPPAILPDAIVEYDEDRDTYFAYLTDGRLPNLRVNREYARMARDRSVPKDDRQFVRTNLSNAQWLIDAVQQRRQTLLRVINVVVAAQRDFFDQGPQALRPLPMTQVADQLGIHVATVSRAVAGKHLQTPRGVFALRKFFSGGTQTSSGEDVAWEAVRVAMQDVVDSEEKTKPMSDEAIAKALKERGIDIARRTVAKYRAQLDIPPARLRKSF